LLKESRLHCLLQASLLIPRGPASPDALVAFGEAVVARRVVVAAVLDATAVPTITVTSFFPTGAS
jgi:hypothetical protein